MDAPENLWAPIDVFELLKSFLYDSKGNPRLVKYKDMNRGSKVFKLCWRGAKLAGMGCMGDALKDYNEAIALEPENAILRYNEGAMLFNSGFQKNDCEWIKQASEAFREAYRLNPKDILALDNQGRAFVALCYLEEDEDWLGEALIALGKAVELNPRNPALLFSYGKVLSALGKMKVGSEERAERFREALKPFEKLVKLTPKDASALLYYVDALVELGMWGGKPECFRKALKVMDCLLRIKEDAKTWDWKGMLLVQLSWLEGKPEIQKDALPAFEKALKLNPGFVRALNNKGMVFYELGKYEKDRRNLDVAREFFGKAINNFDCALEIEPDAQAPRINKNNARKALGKL